jgi:carboxyl-terminal processing protease
MRKYRHITFFILTIIAVLSFSFKDDLFLVSKNLDVFASLYKEIHLNYVEETNSTSLMETGIDAMLSSLDPYTEYIPETEIEDYKLKYVSTQYGGIGAATLFIDGKLFVNEVTEGNPANKNDVKPGDEIIKINNITTAGKDKVEISQLLRGPKGSSLNLTILRDGLTINKVLIREEIKQPNVSYAGLLNNQIGYIKLDKFLENSGQEVKDALLTINKQQPKGIILDLRNNGGGILQEAVKIVNFFVKKDLMVVVQKGRNPEKTVNYKTLNEPILPNIPLIVLINSNSASASEIVAGALQDLDRAVIIGQRSYGKGLVQQAFNLPYNSLVKVTVAKYYTPSGRCIQALDYAHKDKSGIAEKFADSLMKPFATRNGRTVYDGNGVFPDIVIANEKLSPISISLLNKSLFFDYANLYRKNNKEIASAKLFQVSDKDYNDFIASLSNKDYSYTIGAENILATLSAEIEKDQKFSTVKTDIVLLKAKLSTIKKSDLSTHKSEIKRLLETQVVSRYFYEKGKVEQSFQYDKEILKADSLFKNQQIMVSILKGDGLYQTIGTPIKSANSIR